MRTSDLQSPNGKKKKKCKNPLIVWGLVNHCRAYLSPDNAPITGSLMKTSSSTPREWQIGLIHCQKWLGSKIKAQVRVGGNQSQRMSQGREKENSPKRRHSSSTQYRVFCELIRKYT